MNEIVVAINGQLDAGVDLLEGLLGEEGGPHRCRRADRRALSRRRRRPGFAAFPRAAEIEPPRIGEVYTKGTLTLARLGREAPIAAASPSGEVLRNIEGGSLAARVLYPTCASESPRTCRARR